MLALTEGPSIYSVDSEPIVECNSWVFDLRSEGPRIAGGDIYWVYW